MLLHVLPVRLLDALYVVVGPRAVEARQLRAHHAHTSVKHTRSPAPIVVAVLAAELRSWFERLQTHALHALRSMVIMVALLHTVLRAAQVKTTQTARTHTSS